MVPRHEEHMNHYPHHLGDYAKDTAGFNQADHGAYRLLLDAYYATEESLPAEDVYEIGKGTTPVARKAVTKVLKKFQLRDGRYYHKRVEEELAAYRERSEIASLAAQIKWAEQSGEDATALRAQMRTHKRTHKPAQSDRIPNRTPPEHAAAMPASNHKPVTKNQTPEAQHRRLNHSEPSERFAALSSICAAHRVHNGPALALHLRQWEAEGITDEQFTEAIARARDRNPDPALLHAAYIATILPDVVAGKGASTTLTQAEIRARVIAKIDAKEASDAAR